MTTLLPAPAGARPAARPPVPAPPVTGPATRRTTGRPGARGGGAPDPDAARQHHPVATPEAAVLLVGGSVLAVAAVLVAALLAGGGAPAPATPGLPDAGATVGWGQPVVQLLARVLAVMVVGSLLVAGLLVPAPDGLPAPSRRAVRAAAGAAAGWAACEVAGLVLLAASILGRPVARLAPADVQAVATALPAGRTVPAVLLLLATVAVAARGARTAGQARILLSAALAAVVLPVLTTGHPAAAGDHAVTVAVLVVHVVTASLWVGGLAGVLLHLRRPDGDVAVAARAVAVRRLSALALVCAAAVTVTGVVGGLLVTDVGLAGLPGLLASGYGTLLLVKTAAVVLLVAAGRAHRRRTLPALAAGRPGAFVRLGVVETVLMAATLAVAVGLSAAPPPGPTEAPARPGVTDPADVTDPASLTDVTDAAGGTDAAAGTDAAGVTGPAGTAAAEDMSGHDHGELSVAVLVDADRFHVGAPVVAGAPVTVYNTGPEPVDLVADDGAFRTTVPSRTFITFTAPAVGEHPFADPADPRYRDVLRVVPPPG